MTNLKYPIIDIHTHLRDRISYHTKLAKEAGIDTVCYMPNTISCLDDVGKIKNSLKQKRYVGALPVSAITVGRQGKKLVDIRSIRPYVVGFSDDGDCLKNLDLLTRILKSGVLVMAHLEPETQMASKYLKVLKKTGGRLHLQHISKASTINIIRRAKKEGLKFTTETCPHYFSYFNRIENHPVNPPLGTYEDLKSVKKALADGTIDCIASDYAPLPRPKGTGFASFKSFVPLCYGLVLDGTMSELKLKEKLYVNPRKIIKNIEY